VVGKCDLEEKCDGTTVGCPADTFKSTASVCRPVATMCDVSDSCLGTSPFCPPDKFEVSTKVCRTAAGPCDVEEKCSGASSLCPADIFKPAGTKCSGGQCIAGACLNIDAAIPDLTSPDADVRKQTTAYFGELAKLCADFGGNTLVLGSPQQRNLLPGVTHDEAMKYAADTLASAAPTLEDNGVTLAVEPLGPEEGDFLRTAQLGAELVAMIGLPQVRLHLDVKAMSTESIAPADLIRRHHALLAHFHANDPNRQGPGFGEIDFLPIFEALGEVDYQGWVSVEVFDYAPGVERLARESIEYMQACLKKLAGS